MYKQYRNKKTLTFLHGLYRFFRMQFELKNAPETLKRAIYVILSTARYKNAKVYLDDIVLFFKSVEEHKTNFIRVLILLVTIFVTPKM